MPSVSSSLVSAILCAAVLLAARGADTATVTGAHGSVPLTARARVSTAAINQRDTAIPWHMAFSCGERAVEAARGMAADADPLRVCAALEAPGEARVWVCTGPSGTLFLHPHQDGRFGLRISTLRASGLPISLCGDAVSERPISLTVHTTHFPCSISVALRCKNCGDAPPHGPSDRRWPVFTDASALSIETRLEAPVSSACTRTLEADGASVVFRPSKGPVHSQPVTAAQLTVGFSVHINPLDAGTHALYTTLVDGGDGSPLSATVLAPIEVYPASGQVPRSPRHLAALDRPPPLSTCEGGVCGAGRGHGGHGVGITDGADAARQAAAAAAAVCGRGPAAMQPGSPAAAAAAAIRDAGIDAVAALQGGSDARTAAHARLLSRNGSAALTEAACACPSWRAARCRAVASGAPLRVLMRGHLDFDGQKRVWLDVAGKLQGRGVDFTYASVAPVDEDKAFVRELRRLGVPLAYVPVRLSAQSGAHLGGLPGVIAALSRALSEPGGIAAVPDDTLRIAIENMQSAMSASAPDVVVGCTGAEPRDEVGTMLSLLTGAPGNVQELLNVPPWPGTAAHIFVGPSAHVCENERLTQANAEARIPCLRVPVGADAAAADADAAAAAAAREQEDGQRQGQGQERSLRVGVLARLSPEKALSVALQAVAYAEKRLGGRAVKATVVGDGPVLDAAVWHARQLNVSATFLGGVYGNSGRRVLAGWDALVISTLGGETWGMVAVEAMARGVPVVSFASGAQWEFMEPDHTALVADRPDADSLGHALARALSNAGNVTERVREGGRSAVREHLTLARTAQRYLALWRGVAVAGCEAKCGAAA